LAPWRAKPIPVDGLSEEWKARFWIRAGADDPSGCWLWRGGGLDGDGYCQVRLPPTGRLVYVHRLAFTLLRGPVPLDLTIDHLCRERTCLNPAHMRTVPVAVNASARPRVAVCRRAGHPYTPENIYVNPQGYRRCRACRREREGRA
jgi:hypothetical protein